jgi:outer membrane lipoprotein-sorting protein
MGVQRWAAWSRRRLAGAGGLTAFLIALAAGLSAASAPPDLFDRIYAEGQQKNGAMKTLTAAFTETTTSTLLTRPLVATGTVAVQRPAQIALRYTDPEIRRVLIDGARLTIDWPARQVHESRVIGASQQRIQKYFVDSSPDELRRHFEVTASETSDRPNTYLVTMVPTRRQIREGMSRLELWVSRRSLLMEAMRITFPNGDTKLMTFTDVRPDAPIDPSMFGTATR